MLKKDAQKVFDEFTAAQKDFDDAYARLRRFIDKQKLNALKKNLKSDNSKK